MRKLRAALVAAVATVALFACTQPTKPPPPPTTTTQPAPTTTTQPPAPPKPLVIKGKTAPYVVDGGTYESIRLDGNTAPVEIKNVRIDGSAYGGDPLQAGADCIYVIRSASVNAHDFVCNGAKRQGVAVISTRSTATISIHNAVFTGVQRYTFDFEPNLSTQHIHNVLVEDTTATRGLGWLIRHSGCCDSVVAHRNTYSDTAMPEGQLGSGVYGRCNREPAAIEC